MKQKDVNMNDSLIHTVNGLRSSEKSQWINEWKEKKNLTLFICSTAIEMRIFRVYNKLPTKTMP